MDEPSSLIPPIGSVSQVERLFRVNWVAALGRSSRGAPMVMPGFVARQGRRVRLVDLRDLEALLGPLGHIPGVDWVPEDRARSLAGRVGPDEPILLISRTGDSAKEIALDLERQGLRFVAAMNGGMMAWHDLGFSTSRDPSIAGRLDQLRAVVDAPPPAPGPLSLGEVEAHVGDPFSIRWPRPSSGESSWPGRRPRSATLSWST